MRTEVLTRCDHCGEWQYELLQYSQKTCDNCLILIHYFSELCCSD